MKIKRLIQALGVAFALAGPITFVLGMVHLATCSVKMNYTPLKPGAPRCPAWFEERITNFPMSSPRGHEE